MDQGVMIPAATLAELEALRAKVAELRQDEKSLLSDLRALRDENERMRSDYNHLMVALGGCQDEGIHTGSIDVDGNEVVKPCPGCLACDTKVWRERMDAEFDALRAAAREYREAVDDFRLPTEAMTNRVDDAKKALDALLGTFGDV
jgi:predicted  nucleic acid-binding Zn-ribbon protein